MITAELRGIIILNPKRANKFLLKQESNQQMEVRAALRSYRNRLKGPPTHMHKLNIENIN